MYIDKWKKSILVIPHKKNSTLECNSIDQHMGSYGMDRQNISMLEDIKNTAQEEVRIRGEIGA